MERASASQQGNTGALARSSFSSGHRSRQLYRTLVRIAACTILAAWVLGLWYIHSERQQALVRSEATLRSIAVGVAHQLGVMLGEGVGSARSGFLALAATGEDGSRNEANPSAALGRHLSGSGYIKSLFVLEGERFVQAAADGFIDPATTRPGWLASIPPDDSTRPWISPPIPESGAAGSYDFAVAVRASSGRGAMAWVGAVFGSGAIQSLLEEQRLTSGAIALYTESGMPVAKVSRVSAEPRALDAALRGLLQDAIAQRWPGPVEFIGPETGVPMIFMGHLVSGYPIAAVAGLPRSEILAGWARQSQITVGILLATTLLVAFLMMYLKRSIEALSAKESEYRSLFDNAGVSIFLIRGYQFVEINRKTHEIFQLPEGQGSLTLYPWDVSPRLQPDGSSSEVLARERIDEARRSGQVTFRWWHRRLRSGEEFPAQVSLSILDNADADLLLAVVHDLSDLERARAALAELNVDLERRVRLRTEEVESVNRRLALANEELELFAASASHDLRSPLGTISGMAGLLKLELGEGRQDTAALRLGRIVDAVKRMTEIMDGLLALSRATGQEGEAAMVDLAGIAAEIAGDLKQQYRGHDVEVAFQAGMVVSADPRLMRTLLANLLENAWKYTSGVAAPRVRFESRVAPDGGRVYEVADNGVGFDMRFAGKLFKPFRRLHSARDFPGMGLGLATVARIVRHYGGEIGAEGAEGQGAVFRFTLPAAELKS